MVVTRFCPTLRIRKRMHVGHYFNWLINWLYAKGHDGHCFIKPELWSINDVPMDELRRNDQYNHRFHDDQLVFLEHVYLIKDNALTGTLVMPMWNRELMGYMAGHFDVGQMPPTQVLIDQAMGTSHILRGMDLMPDECIPENSDSLAQQDAHLNAEFTYLPVLIDEERQERINMRTQGGAYQIYTLLNEFNKEAWVSGDTAPALLAMTHMCLSLLTGKKRIKPEEFYDSHLAIDDMLAGAGPVEIVWDRAHWDLVAEVARSDNFARDTLKRILGVK